jgi:beta-lactamase superfamily II metal-dependent hydrolase
MKIVKKEKNMKQVVFNVGGALSTYIEFNNKSLLVDIGKSETFNPIIDFLIPLYNKRGITKNEGKYNLNQLIISHPHNDHMSAINDLNNNFFLELLTCPNDNEGMLENEKINWNLIDKNENVKTLREMLVRRCPPLQTTDLQNEFIYYIPPKEVEKNNDLSTESYCNNISIAVYIRINGTKIFMPGDLQKQGMEYIISKNIPLRNILNEGVDILIAPHHGLRSSFSSYMFDHIKNKKTRCINIVSEKTTTEDSNRQVDSRYSSKEFCNGDNNLSTSNDIVYQRKTSNGHIFINYSIPNKPNIEIIDNKDTLIKGF